MDSLWLDLRYSFRSLAARPGFTTLAVLTLAFGIGVNTVAFSAMNALLLRPFRMPDADRVGWITIPSPGNARGQLSLKELTILRSSSRAFEAIAAEGRVPVRLRTSSGTQQSWALLMTANYLHTIEAVPARGRLFAEVDLRGSELPAVVSYRFWSETLGAPESLGGQTIVVNDRSFSVVGVLPDNFQGIGGLFAPDMWLPVERLEVLNIDERQLGSAWLTVFGRLADGAVAAQAQAELHTIAMDLTDPTQREPKRSGQFYPVSGGHPELREIGTGAWLAFGAVAVVLLIACFNVAALLMARAAERQKEIGIRSALGASRARILRQMVLEGLLLASVSGAAALLVAAWSAELIATFSLPSPIPQRLHFGIDATLVLFTVAAVTVAGVLPAILPGLQATRANLTRSMRMESALGAKPSRTRNAFVIAQIAGSTFFVVAALLFARSFTKALAVPTGFDTEHTIALGLMPGLHGYDTVRSHIAFDTLQAQLTATPGVSGVAVADRVPFYVGYPNTTPLSVDGNCRGGECPQATAYAVGRGYFSALGVPLRAGRDFSDTELRTGSAVIVGERLASQTWPGSSAVGQSLRLGPDHRMVEVVGVAAEYVHRNVAEAPGSFLYRPLRDSDYTGHLTVIIRTRDDPRGMLSTVRDQLRALDSNLPPSSLDTMSERMKMPQWMARTTAAFFMICGTLALVLATVGLFGVMYFTVSQRTREFGIRVALGATRRRILGVVIREGLWLAVPGVVLGITAGYGIGRLLSRGLYGIAPGDPVSFGATAVLQVLVALAACALPAYRATRADPMAALRQE